MENNVHAKRYLWEAIKTTVSQVKVKKVETLTQYIKKINVIEWNHNNK